MKKTAPKKKAFPLTVICRFTVKPGSEKAFMKVLAADWPGLVRLGLATKKKPLVYRHTDETGGPVFFQIFTWTSELAMHSAHTLPDVMKSWGAMDPLCEARAGHLRWEFPHVEEVAMTWKPSR